MIQLPSRPSRQLPLFPPATDANCRGAFGATSRALPALTCTCTSYRAMLWWSGILMQKLNNRPQIPAASEGPAGCVSQAGDGFSILVRMHPSRATQKPVGIPTLPVFFCMSTGPYYAAYRLSLVAGPASGEARARRDPYDIPWLSNDARGLEALIRCLLTLLQTLVQF